MAQLQRWTRCGQALVEVLLALGLSAILLPALLTGLVSSRQGQAQQQQRIQATALLSEAIEATRSVRENGWTTFAVNGTYHPAISGSTWALIPGPETLSGFTRSVVVGDFSRDGNPDPSTKKVDVTVTWPTPLSTAVNATLYLTRYLDNLVFIHSTVADFNSGTHTGTVVTNTAGGEVTLASGGTGNWCEPGDSIVAQLDLPKSGKATAVTSTVGEAYAGTGENSAGESFADILVSNTHPPVPSIIGTVDGYKTNDIFGEPDYGYIATDNNHKEVVIIGLSSLPFSESGYFNAPGNDFGESVFVQGSVGYVVVEDRLYNFDLGSKTGSRPALDANGVPLSDEGTSVYVVGSYAYVAIEGNNNVQLDIVDVSNPSNMQKVGSADVNNQSAVDVFVNNTGTRAYIVTNATSPDEREFHIVNTEDKAHPVKVGPGYYTQGMNPEGVELATGNKAIVVGQGGEEYQVVDITNEQAPTRCGGLEVDTGIFDIASVVEPDGDAYSYIVTGDASSEFKIIAGGPGGQYTSSGTFESAVFDPGYSTAFNRLDVTYTKPANTDITFQIAIADPVSGSCTAATYVFVGPDATSATFFGDDGVIPLNDDGVGFENPARCLKYRAYLSTTDFSSTPIFEQATVNYSP